MDRCLWDRWSTTTLTCVGTGRAREPVTPIKKIFRALSFARFRTIAQLSTRDARLQAAVELLMEQITEIGEHGLARVILVCPPLSLGVNPAVRGVASS